MPVYSQRIGYKPLTCMCNALSMKILNISYDVHAYICTYYIIYTCVCMYKCM